MKRLVIEMVENGFVVWPFGPGTGWADNSDRRGIRVYSTIQEVAAALPGLMPPPESGSELDVEQKRKKFQGYMSAMQADPRVPEPPEDRRKP